MTIGSLAPLFTLLNQDGQPCSLESLRGKWLLLYFYPEDDTPGCTTQACGLRDIWSELQKLNVVVLGVSPDDVESHASFQQKYSLPFTLLADPEKEVLNLYEAWGEKNLYGNISVGVKRSSVLIDPEGKIAKHYKRAIPETHAQTVLTDVQKLQSGN